MAVEIIKVDAKSIFTKTKTPNAKYVVNQYIGCEHGCVYCYAKFMCRWRDYGKWGSWVEAKMNAPELARKYVTGKVVMSSISDPYQPVEKELQLTRRILQDMDKRTELSILTKSNLRLRDVDLLKEFNKIEVGLTINNFEGKMKELFEPHSPNNEERINSLKNLKKDGIKTFAFISPVIPELIDINILISKSRDFVNYYIVEMMNINAAGKEFRKLLKKNYPKSYEILIDKDMFEEFMDVTKNVLIESGVSVPQFVTHYPKFEVVDLCAK